MDYIQARELIKTGDVVAVGGNKITAFFQRVGRKQWGGVSDYAQYTHCGIAVWIESRLFLYEMDGRYNVYRPLSQYQHKNMAVFASHVDESKLRNEVNKSGDVLIKYDAPSFIPIGLRMITGIVLAFNHVRIVCTELLRGVLQAAGYAWTIDFPVSPSVMEVCNAMHASKKFEIKGG